MRTATHSKTQKNVLPYQYYLVTVFSLVFLGIVDTIYLGYSHYKNYTDTTYNSFCAISNAINCDTVSQSAWSVFLGIPISYWGFFGYLLVIILLFNVIKPGKENLPIWSLLLFLSLLYSIVSIFLGYISATRIKAFCILCILTYGINLTLALVAWLIRQRFPSGCSLFEDIRASFSIIRTKKTSLVLFFILVLTLIIFRLQIHPYWHFQYSSPTTEGVETGITREGHPWIGSEDAKLVIEEYADYQCFQCAKMHQMVRKLVSQFPSKLKLIHHHYPLDHEYNPIVVPKPFHIGAGKMALFAIHALYTGQFWDVNDVLFEFGKQGASFNTKLLAEQTGMTSGELAAAITSVEYQKLLAYDIKKGMKLRITSTPTFVINGQKYVGNIPPSILDKIIQ